MIFVAILLIVSLCGAVCDCFSFLSRHFSPRFLSRHLSLTCCSLHQKRRKVGADCLLTCVMIARVVLCLAVSFSTLSSTLFVVNDRTSIT
jgi:hypothetical protein